MRRAMVVLGAVAAGALLVPVSAAQALPGGLEISPDGTSYSSSLPGALFTTISHLVPGDNDQSEFYLRNSSSEPGYLRITLRDVTSSESDFADALTLGVSTPGNSGTPVSLLEASPCRVLLEGEMVSPGQVVRVTTTLMLGQLHGLAGQEATATAALGVSLSGLATSLPSTDCGPTGTVLPVVPVSPAQPTTRPRMTIVPGLPDGMTAEVPRGPVAPGFPETELPVLSPPGLLGIDPNTWHLFEEYLILIPVGASILGGAVFGAVAWRRRNSDDQLEASA